MGDGPRDVPGLVQGSGAVFYSRHYIYLLSTLSLYCSVYLSIYLSKMLKKKGKHSQASNGA